MNRQRGGRTTMLVASLFVVASVVAASCSSSPDAAPRWPGFDGDLSTITSTACPRILVVGDSIAHGTAPFLSGALRDSGRCADVTDRSVPGSSVGDTLNDMDAFLAESTPNIVLVHHIGNPGVSGPAWGDPNYLKIVSQDALKIVDKAHAVGAHVYWALPPLGAWRCEWETLNAKRWRQWESWIDSDLTDARPEVTVVDWRAPFGGDDYSQAFTFDDGVHDVRWSDCVHFSEFGSQLAAQATAVALQDEWPAAP